jgi:guanylate kinase
MAAAETAQSGMISSGGSGGLLLVISGPSGVGKTSIVREVLARFGGDFSVSATTRPPGPGEVDGRDYMFVDEPTFQGMVDRDLFLEHAQVFGRSWYGTPREPVERAIAQGRIVALDIDVQGAEQVRARHPGAFGVFILPPSEDELLRRLRARGREDEAAIMRRFSESTREIARARAGTTYDAFVVNDSLRNATEKVCELIAARLGRR